MTPFVCKQYTGTSKVVHRLPRNSVDIQVCAKEVMVTFRRSSVESRQRYDSKHLTPSPGVCQSVCEQDTSKSFEPIFTKVCGRTPYALKEKSIRF